MDRAYVGAAGERAAIRYLKRRGFRIIKTNYSSRFGEIDIIAADKNVIVFVEVKTRAFDAIDAPGAWVTHAKQRRIIKTARFYMAYNNMDDIDVRFDVMEVTAVTERRMKVTNHIQNAFGL